MHLIYIYKVHVCIQFIRIEQVDDTETFTLSNDLFLVSESYINVKSANASHSLLCVLFIVLLQK